jgi:hypothetical protein
MQLTQNLVLRVGEPPNGLRLHDSGVTRLGRAQPRSIKATQIQSLDEGSPPGGK